MNEVFLIAGTLVDAGDMEGSRGIKLEVGDRLVTITGLTKYEVIAAAKYYGQTIAISVLQGDLK